MLSQSVSFLVHQKTCCIIKASSFAKNALELSFFSFLSLACSSLMRLKGLDLLDGWDNTELKKERYLGI